VLHFPFSDRLHEFLLRKCLQALAKLETTATTGPPFVPPLCPERLSIRFERLRIEAPTSRDGDVLLAIDLKEWETPKHTGGTPEASTVHPPWRARTARTPVGRSTLEHQIPARHNSAQGMFFKVVLPDALL